MQDMMARAQAAGGMLGQGEPPPPPMPEAGGMPPEAEGAPPAMDLEGALAGVEAALEGMPPEMAEEARSHVNAIREIASKDVGPAMAAEAEPPPGPEGGAEPLPEEPKLPA